RNPSAPIVRARPRNQSQRTTCSSVVGPPAPYAAVIAGAGTRTPNVQTPETTCESADTARQRTVYAPSLSGRTFATTSVPTTRAGPAKSRPTPSSTRTAPGSNVTL